MDLSELNDSDIAADWRWPQQTAAYALLLNHGGLSSLPNLPAAITERRTQIVVCDLSLNYMTSVPSVRSFGALRRLNLSCNLLTVVAFENQPSLVELDLSQNLITSLHLADLPGLMRLDCSTNELNGDLFDLRLPRLSVLNIAHNNFSALPALASLAELIADHNNIQDISAISQMPQLTSLSLACNKIGSLDATVQALLVAGPSLRALNLWGNPISDFRMYRMTVVDAVDSLEKLDERPLRPFIRERLVMMKEQEDVQKLLKEITLNFSKRIENEHDRLRDYIGALRKLEHDAQLSFDNYRNRMESELHDVIRYVQARKSAEPIPSTAEESAKTRHETGGEEGVQPEHIVDRLQQPCPAPFVSATVLSADEVKQTLPEPVLQPSKKKSKMRFWKW